MKPLLFTEFIGQRPIKNELEVRIAAAKLRDQPLDHILLCGPNQMGKWAFAKAIASEMGVKARMIDTNIKSPGELAAIITGLQAKDILLIEDVEELNKSVLSFLTEAAKDFTVHVVIGKGPGAKEIILRLPRFTIIATSSRPFQINKQLSEVLSPRYDFASYTLSEISQLLSMFASQHNQEIDYDAAELVARYCEGNPGKAKVLIKRVADFCLVHEPSSSISMSLAKSALSHLGYLEGIESVAELAQRINIMDGTEFEEFIARFFVSKGYAVQTTKVSGDHGIDLFAKKRQEYIGIQCKRWAKPVGEPVIRDFYGSLLNSEAKLGIVIATSGFTSQAIGFAHGKQIKLIDLDMLIELVRNTK